MKNNLSLILFGLMSFGNWASAANSIPELSIDCSNGACVPNFNVLSPPGGASNYSTIDVGAAGGNITVSTQSQQSPQSLRMNVVNGVFPDLPATPGYNLTVDLSSHSKNADAGNAVVIGDNFANLNIKLNGYSGKAGKDASTICADNIKSNLYGPDSLSFFNNFRLNNPGTSSSKCSFDDLNFLQANKFKCDSGFVEDITTNSVYSVNVQRIPKVNRCQTNLNYDVCVRKNVLLSCGWKIYNGSSSITGALAIGSNLITNAYSIKGNTTNGGNTITTVSNVVGVSVGQTIIGSGIPPNATVTAVNGSSLSIYPLTASIDAINSSFFVGVSIGQEIFSPSFPAGTTITAIDTTLNQITTSQASKVDNSALTVSSSPLNVDPATTVSSSSPTYFSTSISRKIPENEYTYFRNLMSDADICNLHVAQEISDPSYSTPLSVVNPIYSNANSYAGCSGNCSWKVSTISSSLTTPGLNGNEPAAGSDWGFAKMLPGDHCDTGTNPATGFYTTYKTVNVNYVAYDRTNTACAINDLVTYSNSLPINNYPAQDFDPNKVAVWFYTGSAQEPDFGSEATQCDLGNCPVSSVVSDLNQTLDTITPQDGENGSKQGNGLILIYDAATISTESNIGVAGAGGKNDIINQSSLRVCSKQRDAATDGLNSDYARNPIVSFNRYNWSAIKTTASGNPGQQPVNIGATVTVWKKLDSSVRAFLQNEFFFPKP